MGAALRNRAPGRALPGGRPVVDVAVSIALWLLVVGGAAFWLTRNRDAIRELWKPCAIGIALIGLLVVIMLGGIGNVVFCVVLIGLGAFLIAKEPDGLWLGLVWVALGVVLLVAIALGWVSDPLIDSVL